MCICGHLQSLGHGFHWAVSGGLPQSSESKKFFLVKYKITTELLKRSWRKVLFSKNNDFFPENHQEIFQYFFILDLKFKIRKHISEKKNLLFSIFLSLPYWLMIFRSDIRKNCYWRRKIQSFKQLNWF